jgi:hypothetical protein
VDGASVLARDEAAVISDTGDFDVKKPGFSAHGVSCSPLGLERRVAAGLRSTASGAAGRRRQDSLDFKMSSSTWLSCFAAKIDGRQRSRK